MNTQFLSTQYVALLLAGLVIMVVFLLIIVTFAWVHQKKRGREESDFLTFQSQHQQKLLEVSIQQEERERLRIAQDLHDDVGAQLSAAKMYVESVLEEIEREDTRRKVTDISGMLDHSLQKIRDISKQITPPLLLEYGLTKALEHLAMVQNKIGKVDVYFTSGKYLRQEDLVEIMLYRVVQEIVTNAMKYGRPNRIDIRLEGDEKQLILEVWDNGLPFDIKEKIANNKNGSRGNGLKNIESRLQNCGAALIYRHDEGKNKVCITTQTYALS